MGINAKLGVGGMGLLNSSVTPAVSRENEPSQCLESLNSVLPGCRTQPYTVAGT